MKMTQKNLTTDTKWKTTLLSSNANLRDAINNRDKSALRIVLVIDDCGRLHGTVSDGDIRRGLLSGFGLDAPILAVTYCSPLVVSKKISREAVKQVMIRNKIQQIPIVDDKHHVIGVYFWDEIYDCPDRENLLIIMAGGKGTRLSPYTETCPKPLVPVAGKPMLEHIITKAKREGFSNFIISVRHLGHMIEDYFGNGETWGVKIDYLRENEALGTAGALKMLTCPGKPIVVTNGDVLTDINYGSLLDFHIQHNASGTMAVRLHEWQNPYGVVQTQEIDIIGFNEKPISRAYINAGVYCLSPEALSLIPEGPSDMPALFNRIKSHSKRIVAYAVHEHWLDVGSPIDLSRAEATAMNSKTRT